jgi:hypothetical protein
MGMIFGAILVNQMGGGYLSGGQKWVGFWLQY